VTRLKRVRVPPRRLLQECSQRRPRTEVPAAGTDGSGPRRGPIRSGSWSKGQDLRLIRGEWKFDSSRADSFDARSRSESSDSRAPARHAGGRGCEARSDHRSALVVRRRSVGSDAPSRYDGERGASPRGGCSRFSLRVWPNGKAPGFQPGHASSTLAARFHTRVQRSGDRTVPTRRHSGVRSSGRAALFRVGSRTGRGPGPAATRDAPLREV
jgi:hypothetical protein